MVEFDAEDREGDRHRGKAGKRPALQLRRDRASTSTTTTCSRSPSGLKPSARGELEITDLNSVYLEAGELRVEKLGRGIAWLDTGTHESLNQASNFIHAVQERQGLMVACVEEIAFRLGYIGADDLLGLARDMQKNAYGEYLVRLAGGRAVGPVKFEPLEIPDVILIEPDVHADDRGFFFEIWQAEKYAAGGVDARFVQDNQSRSSRGALRGLHAQLEPAAQGKLVRAISGEIWDVAVDIRRGSPHFGKFVSARLSGENFRQIWVPPGFAHGFCVLSEGADVEYKCTAPWLPEAEIAVAWNDPAIGVPWPIDEPLLSPRDGAAPPLAELTERLPRWTG